MTRASTTPTRWVPALVVGAWVVAAGSMAGCTALDGAGGADDGPQTSETGSTIVPLDSVTDVVTWSDTVAVVTVLSEAEAVSDHPDEDAGPLVGRRVEVRIDDVVWSRPAGEQPPSTFTTQAPGWVREDDGSLTPLQTPGGVLVEVGGTYLAPIVLIDEWGFDTDEVLTVEDGRLGAAPGQQSSWALSMDGLTLDQAAQVLADGDPHRDAGPLGATTEEQLAEQLRDLARERRQHRRR